MRVSLLLLVVSLALAAAGTAAAATPPSATTGPVSSVGATSATVTGTVNPNGTPTTWYVEYGTTTGYGSKTSATNAGSGTSGVPVSASLSGLAAGTTYHYRVVAKSSGGTTNGADGILTTSAAPAVVTGGASNVATTSATVSGTVNPNGRPTTWYFEYGTSTSYGSKTSSHDAGSGTAALDVSDSLTGLQAGRTYHYRLVATSDAGTSRGADRTLVASTKSAVTTGTISVLGDTSAKATGSVNPNGASTSAWFEYGTTTSYGSKSPAISVGSGTSAKNVSATLSGLAAATTYHVRLVASSSAGTTYGADTTFATTGKPRASSSAATLVTGTTATLNGAVAPNGHSTTWYAEWGTSTAYGTKTPAKNVGGGTNTIAVSAQLTGLVAGTVYHFRIVASNASGTSTSGDTTFTTAGPGVTLAASVPTVVAGRSVRLSGTTITHGTNEQVTLWAQPFGAGSFVQLAIVQTAVGGTWAYDASPKVATTYKAEVPSGSSPLLTVGVRPAVTLRSVHGRFRVTVHGPVSYAGRPVLLQRRKGTGWVDLGFRRLGASGTATFAPRLRAGRWTLRALVGARPGLLAGTSNALAVRRR